METPNPYPDEPTLSEKQQTSSFTLKQTAKGSQYWDIKIYNNDPAEIKKQVKDLDDWAREEYGEAI